MQSYDFIPDNVKYFTRIREFKYQRPNPQNPRPNIQPQSMISLPMPVNMPGDVYQEMVREFDMGEIGTTIDLLQKGTSSASLSEKAGAAVIGGAAAITVAGGFGLLKSGAAKVGDIAGLTALGISGLDLLSAISGKTRNPHTAMIFDRMGIRHYNLNFLLAPRSAQQSAQINTALSHMRRMMHPSFVPGLAFVLDYPSMFTVEFAGFAQDRIGIPNITHSFLRSMNVNASPQGQVYFENGWPALLDVQMEFVELEAKTREYFNLPTTG